MPIIFRSPPVSEPLTFESIGVGWLQDRVSRPRGYPFYHYLQTERGFGRVEIPGGSYILHPGEGILLAPFIRHTYEKESGEWYTCFASVTGTLESCIPQMLGSRQVIRTGPEQGRQLTDLISGCMKRYSKRPVDEKQLSIDCYSFLMHFVDGAHNRMLTQEPLYRKYVEPVLKEIEKHYYLDLTVEDLSGLVYITPQYLSRLFRRFLNCSTYEYLISFRMSRDCPQERLRGRKPFYRRIQEVDRSHPFRLPALQLKNPDRYPRPGFRFSIPFNFQNLPL